MEPAVFGTHDDRTLEQLHDVASRAERAALMADGHLGYVMPIGGVAAYDGRVSVAGVGFDIACGNAAIRTDLHADDLAQAAVAEEAADRVAVAISFGMGGTNPAHDAPTDHPLFRDDAWNAVPTQHRERLREKAREQLGTVGGGNHYVDVCTDEQGDVWVGVHFGSRGLGHAVASGTMALAQGAAWGQRVRPSETLLELDSELGRGYWSLMHLAGRYAYAGREWVARKVVEILGGRELELVHNHHNFAWRERHDERDLIVVRKGATPAFPGQRSFVGGSMGDDAVILEGSQERSDAQRAALFSTVHGAGRVMSRTEAAGRRKGRRRTRGKIDPEAMRSWVKERGVVLRGGGLDEAPQAYRRLDEVLAAQGDSVGVLHRLRPRIVVMAGDEGSGP
ncbi:MAG: RtcB family protein [Trueperaceae bacterium]